MTQYLLSVHMTESDYETPPEEMEQAYADVDRFNEDSSRTEPGCSPAACMPRRRRPSSTPRGADVTVTDGPYAETKEQIGGFWVIEAADLDAALELAKKASAACGARRRGAPVPGRAPADVPTCHDVAPATDFREESGRAVATLIRIFGDIDVAEEAVQEAFVVAVAKWPETGTPPKPGGVDRHDGAEPRDRPAAPRGDPA